MHACTPSPTHNTHTHTAPSPLPQDAFDTSVSSARALLSGLRLALDAMQNADKALLAGLDPGSCGGAGVDPEGVAVPGSGSCGGAGVAEAALRHARQMLGHPPEAAAGAAGGAVSPLLSGLQVGG